MYMQYSIRIKRGICRYRIKIRISIYTYTHVCTEVGAVCRVVIILTCRMTPERCSRLHPAGSREGPYIQQHVYFIYQHSIVAYIHQYTSYIIYIVQQQCSIQCSVRNVCGIYTLLCGPHQCRCVYPGGSGCPQLYIHTGMLEQHITSITVAA